MTEIPKKLTGLLSKILTFLGFFAFFRMVRSQNAFGKSFGVKTVKSYFCKFWINAFFDQTFSPQSKDEWLFWCLWLVVILSRSPSRKSVSKMVTGKREADFFKLTENCQILLANKQRNAFFSKIKNANISFWGFIKKIAREHLLQCLICRSCRQWFASYGKNLTKKPVIGFCGS